MARAFERLRQASPTLSVGVLTADLLALGQDLGRLEATDVPMVHVDVMDGSFVPMLTVGPLFLSALKTPLLKDAHLMIREPLRHVDAFVESGADVITVHVESCDHVHRVLQHLASLENTNDPERGLVRGVAINPGTALSVLEPLLDDADLIVLLAVNPGWSGQTFIEATLRRVEAVWEMIARHGRDILLCVDGGIKRDNIGRLAGTGVDIVVTGSAVYDGGDPAANARAMLRTLRSSGDAP